MHVKRSITLETSSAIIDIALKIAHDNAINPLAIVVLDSGGNPVAFKCEDGSGILRYNVAFGKAYGALGMGTSSRDLRDRMAQRPIFANALSAASDGQFIPVPGGVLILDEDNHVIGAVGVSGDTSEKDEYCAINAIKEAGYSTAPVDVDKDWNK